MSSEGAIDPGYFVNAQSKKVRQVFRIKIDLMFLQQLNIFISEILFLVMRFLVLDISPNPIHMTRTNCKGRLASVPVKSRCKDPSFIYPFGRTRFEFSNKLCRCHIGPKPEQDVYMIRHSIDLNQELIKLFCDPGDVLKQPVFKCVKNQTVSVFNGTHMMVIQLGK